MSLMVTSQPCLAMMECVMDKDQQPSDQLAWNEMFLVHTRACTHTYPEKHIILFLLPVSVQSPFSGICLPGLPVLQVQLDPEHR